MAKKNKRFIVVYNEDGMIESTQILVDKLTGVNYLFHKNGYSGGLTPLLDAYGKPVVTTAPIDE